jgi:hypothetical protein
MKTKEIKIEESHWFLEIIVLLYESMKHELSISSIDSCKIIKNTHSIHSDTKMEPI